MNKYMDVPIETIAKSASYSMSDYLEKDNIIGYTTHSMWYNETENRFCIIMKNDKGNELIYSGSANMAATHCGYLNDIQDDILNGYFLVYNY